MPGIESHKFPNARSPTARTGEGCDSGAGASGFGDEVISEAALRPQLSDARCIARAFGRSSSPLQRHHPLAHGLKGLGLRGLGVTVGLQGLGKP